MINNIINFLADNKNKRLDSCDQSSGNCTCFSSTNGSIECGCSVGYELSDDSFICQGERLATIISLC